MARAAERAAGALAEQSAANTVAGWGATKAGDAFRFRLWAPGHERVELLLGDGDAVHALHDVGGGWHERLVPAVVPGTRYRFRLGDRTLVPDPASRWQPDGVHGPSATVDPSAFRWTDAAWAGLALEDAVLYELHIGTFTAEGTFDAAIPRLAEVRALGATAIEIMPVAQFPGTRNWGYDGVFPYAPQNSYGGPDGLRRLVDAAHRAGLAVVLDVVYNHLGPEGNYLPAITSGRIFTERHETPWGAGINFDDAGSAAVREFFVRNALHWIEEYHIDGLRLDAAHAIEDDSDEHLLAELARRVRGAGGRSVLLFAEDERNERRLLEPADYGGTGLDAVWADDFHHVVRRLAAGDREGYYAAYAGTVEELVRVLERGWLYEGEVYPPTGEVRGTSPLGLAPARFVHCLQNHDQVGNRAFGERLHHEIELPVYRAASALLLTSAHTPLLWMGQEWAASTPFLYFTSHPSALGQLVTEGRRSEFGQFAAFSDPEVRETIPDPQAESTFRRSRLRWEERTTPPHAGVLALYTALLELRRSHPALRGGERHGQTVARLAPAALALRRRSSDEDLLVVVGFGGPLELELDRFEIANAHSGWRLRLSTEAAAFGGDEALAHFADGRIHLRGAAALVLAGAGSA